MPNVPPAHFVLSITPVEVDVPTTTTSRPSVTATVSPPDPTIGPPLPIEGERAAGDPATDPAGDGWGDWFATSRVVLACNPDAGTHPTARRACQSLRNVGGYFERLPNVLGACPRIYAPVEVEAIGYWGDRRVDFTRTFGNRCEAAYGTDNVFRF